MTVWDLLFMIAGLLICLPFWINQDAKRRDVAQAERLERLLRH